jgi:hypothetical protein
MGDKSVYLKRSNEVTRVGPDRILVQFGGNDLDCANANEQSAEEIILMLISICSLYLSRPNVEHVTILQLLPRHETRHCPPVVYNKLVRHANTYLKEQIQAVPGLHYWNIYGVKNSAVNIFVDDVQTWTCNRTWLPFPIYCPLAWTCISTWILILVLKLSIV